MKRVRSHDENPERQSLYRKAILIAIGGNLFLAVIKGLLAWISGSGAIFSDAANSLSDSFYSLLMGIGLYVSQLPADESHPQGHIQFEPLVSVFIGIAMGVAGGLSFWNSLKILLGEKPSIELGWPSVVLVGAIIIKFIMYRLMENIGDRCHSPAIKASAKDNLVDIISSTAALIGIIGARYLHPAFDPYAGLFVSIWIFKASGEILWENFGYLTGRGASEELANKVVELASQIPDVQDIHHVIAEYIGPRLRIDAHINVDGNMTLSDAHDIGEKVRSKIESLAEVDLVYVHVEPAQSQEEIE